MISFFKILDRRGPKRSIADSKEEKLPVVEEWKATKNINGMQELWTLSGKVAQRKQILTEVLVLAA